MSVRSIDKFYSRLALGLLILAINCTCAIVFPGGVLQALWIGEISFSQAWGLSLFVGFLVFGTWMVSSALADIVSRIDKPVPDKKLKKLPVDLARYLLDNPPMGAITYGRIREAKDGMRKKKEDASLSDEVIEGLIARKKQIEVLKKVSLDGCSLN